MRCQKHYLNIKSGAGCVVSAAGVVFPRRVKWLNLSKMPAKNGCPETKGFSDSS
jgi:hypothetical protein